MLGDLKSRKLIIIKGLLFLAAGLAAAGLLLLRHPGWMNAFLIAVAVWAACRAYYFVFYVITAYVDPSYRYAGLLSALRYLRSKRRK